MLGLYPCTKSRRGAICTDDDILKGQLPGHGERFPWIVKMAAGWEKICISKEQREKF